MNRVSFKVKYNLSNDMYRLLKEINEVEFDLQCLKNSFDYHIGLIKDDKIKCISDEFKELTHILEAIELSTLKKNNKLKELNKELLTMVTEAKDDVEFHIHH